MANDRTSKIEDALIQLVDELLPPVAGEDEESVEERRDEATDRARDFINSRGIGRGGAEVTEIREVINKRCLWSLDILAITNTENLLVLRQGYSSEDQIRLSNLVSRLVSKPVLSRKAEILDLFYQLSPIPEPTSHEASRSFSQRQRDRNSFSAERRNLRSRDGQASENVSVKGASARHERHRTAAKEHADSTRPDDGEGKATAQGEGPGIAPSEPTLLRDLPYMLQGVSSDSLSYSAESGITFSPLLPVPIISLLHSLAEPSLLYQKLSVFVKSHQDGSILQSLQAAIGREVQSYLGLVATLDGEIRRALTAIENDPSRSALGKTGVTLKRCVFWTREATMGLRLMSVIVEESHDKKGGQLISLVHGFSKSNGDPFVRAFAERLLSHITRPFYDMLRQWIYDGELSDPFLEFFVTEQSIDQPDPDSRNRTGGASVWEDKYSLDEALIPSVMRLDFAKKVFLIGKSLNFIRHGCADSDWVESYSKSKSTELHYGDTLYLESSIGAAYETTMAQLIQLMQSKFHLSTHLSALKRFLLLGQGDFIALLMESLSSSLDRPTNTLYRHNLTAQLEHAIRGSNAQYSPADVLRRLDARMLEASHGEVGWDAFTLEYKISPPLDVVVSAWGSKQYLKVFNFLWRVKRVEFALGSTWRRCTTGARGVLASFAARPGPQPQSPLAQQWKLARATIAEMIHFITQLQYYILFEVIEASWDSLQAAMRRPGCTLDDLIDAHATYLRAITHKGLLGGSSGKTETEGFLSQLHSILKTMLGYRDAVDGLYSLSVAELSAQSTSSPSGHSVEPTDPPSPPPLLQTPNSRPATEGGGVLGPLKQRLQSLAADFRARLNVLLGDLAHQPDVDMRFLGVVMNFNDVYEPARRKRRGAAVGVGKTPKGAG
ncbi:MAG: Microtubule-nucleating Tub4p (gamma-tubulin) complex component [Vezdaea aestivalis]|nr:MAG: Microtubule-nucleating Tub4p (gamma-tubulin) complex component [Vezdaea aestivalis]